MLERSGLVLTAEKGYLVQSRLEPLARNEGLASVEALLARLRSGRSEPLIEACVNALATHESYFFRDGVPFEQLMQAVLPPLIASRHSAKRLRIWCAACSSGQEPYSIAMILQEMGASLPGWKLEILGTDMSDPILRKAIAGLYSDFEVKRGLSPERLKSWFTPEGSAWKISPRLQQMVQFRPHNLLQGPSSFGVFDLILCRNVLIYFNMDNKRQVLDGISRALAPDGALMLGTAETVLGIGAAFEAQAGLRGIYRLAGHELAKTADAPHQLRTAATR
jgi:chemotaxis protein methyltransferase CheR